MSANATVRTQHAKVLAELWTNAPTFTCPREFLAVLTDCLDELCEAHGKPLPGDFAEMFKVNA